MDQDTSRNRVEDSWPIIVLGTVLNPFTIIIGIMLFTAMALPPTVRNQPIVTYMLLAGAVQYFEFWSLILLLFASSRSQKRPVTSGDIGALLLSTIPFYGLSFFILLHPMNMVLKIILIIISTIAPLIILY